jgi:hypothetical protein
VAHAGGVYTCPRGGRCGLGTLSVRRTRSLPRRTRSLPQDATDALHRQIGIHRHSGLLFRKNEQTAREASRRASASHGTLLADATGSGDGSTPLPVEGPVQKACTAEELCDPSAPQVLTVHETDAAKLVEGRGDARNVLAVCVRCRR